MTAATSPTSREQAIAAAGEAYAVALERLASRTPREAALAAWRPGGPSVEELETAIAAERGHTLGRVS